MGVPRSAILLETKATNTGDNTLFSRQLLQDEGLDIVCFWLPSRSSISDTSQKRVIVVQKPYMERRTYATVKKRWPEVELMVTSPRLSFDTYFQVTVSLFACLIFIAFTRFMLFRFFRLKHMQFSISACVWQDPVFREEGIALMVGDLQRIKIYPSKGFQIEQSIPPGVWAAYERLVQLGYTKYVIQ
jgi:uncharacterized SAM-binding protein YcdF (DUF218 family)